MLRIVDNRSLKTTQYCGHDKIRGTPNILRGTKDDPQFFITLRFTPILTMVDHCYQRFCGSGIVFLGIFIAYLIGEGLSISNQFRIKAAYNI